MTKHEFSEPYFLALIFEDTACIVLRNLHVCAEVIYSDSTLQACYRRHQYQPPITSHKNSSSGSTYVEKIQQHFYDGYL
jgi:hypothetical protein